MIDALRSWSQLRATIRHAQESPGLLRFIVGRFFYSDPVNTAIVVMSAFATQAIGFSSAEALNIRCCSPVGPWFASFGWAVFRSDGPTRTPCGSSCRGPEGSPARPALAGSVPDRRAVLGSGLGGVGVTTALLMRLSMPTRSSNARLYGRPEVHRGTSARSPMARSLVSC